MSFDDLAPVPRSDPEARAATFSAVKRGICSVAVVLVVGLSAVVGGVSAAGAKSAAATSTTAPADYRTALTKRLAKEYGDAPLAATVVGGLNADLLTKLEAKVPLAQVATSSFLAYRAPRVRRGEVHSVVVFAFGNRLGADGSLAPGPTNEALAKVTERFVKGHPVPVYAQTEIAQLLVADGVKRVTSIDPVVGADGKVVYLSTAGVAEQVVSKAQAAGEPLGTVGVIGFADHAVRCVLTARAAGMTGAVPKGVVAPERVRPRSRRQSWTANRASYLATDLIGRITTL